MTIYFYTNVAQYGNKILVRGYDDKGRPQKLRIDFQPTLYVTGRKCEEPWVTLDGKRVCPIQPGTMRDTREFIERYKDVEGFEVFGNTNYVYQYISDTFFQDITFDKDYINIQSIDIETATEDGFPSIEHANEEILLITIQNNKTKEVRTYGTRPYDNSAENVDYRQSRDEYTMLKRFVEDYVNDCPDIITGWNINFFDIPYLIRRITKILGEDFAKKFSPWGLIKERKIFVKGNEEISYDITGVAVLDYIDLYKKFTYSAQESYRLDYIASQELGENKLELPGENFKEAYTKHWQTFVDYNIRDVELVDKLEDKMRLVELAIVMAYNARVNYEDVYSQVRMWDTIIYNHLRSKHIVIPNKKESHKDSAIEGAYVKDPLVGKHEWVVSFDLNSLYPHLIMQYNISPETIRAKVTGGVEKFLREAPENNGYSVTANGWCYDKEQLGFMPELMEKFYIDRSKAKKQMLKIQQEYENDKSKKHLLKEVSRLNNLQMAMKISLNSAYGAMANQYFRYYDERMSEGITLSGQLSIRWMETKFNEYFNKLLKTEGEDYVIAVDTDSVYLRFGPLIDSLFTKEQQEDKLKMVQFIDTICEDKIQKFIDKCYAELAERQNAFTQKMIMKREVIADKAIWTAKKRYVLNVHNSEGVQYEKPKLKIMGLEMVKSSTPAVVRDKLKESLDVILNKTEQDLHIFVRDYHEKFRGLPVEEIAFPRSVNGLKQYGSSSDIYSKGTPIHVRGTLMYNHLLKKHKLDNKYPLIKEGEKIKFVYLIEPNTIQEDVVSFLNTLPKEFSLHKYIDYEKQFQKVFLDPLSIVIEPIGWSVEEKSSLEDFFG
jgi:DNA polymerase elongation subunit (family B)